MTIQNPHSEALHKAIASLKELTGSLDGWNFTGEKDGVKLYSKSDSTPFVIVRGDYVIANSEYTIREVATVATSPGCRKIWDDKFDTAEPKQFYNNNEALFWSKVKAPWPISPRDLSTVFLRELSDDEVYTVLVSVEDATIPVVSGCVRANLFISGWRVYKSSEGIVVSYVTQIDLAGNIPSAFLKSVQQQVPLCAGSVAKYVKDYGFPPVIEDLTAQIKSESFDHGKREYVIELEGSGISKWHISNKMYPSGVKVTVTGKGHHDVVDNTVVVTDIVGPTTIKISKA